MDDELEQLAKERLGERYGLSPEQSRRLRGGTLAELESDAAALCGELGLPVLGARDRDDTGRFATAGQSMNAKIRSAAGR